MKLSDLVLNLYSLKESKHYTPQEFSRKLPWKFNETAIETIERKLQILHYYKCKLDN